MGAGQAPTHRIVRMINLQNVTTSFPIPGNDRRIVVKDMSVQIGRGEMAYLVGPSGSGKSTLLRLMYMDLFPEKGFVQVAGFRSDQIEKHEIPLLMRSVGVSTLREDDAGAGARVAVSGREALLLTCVFALMRVRDAGRRRADAGGGGRGRARERLARAEGEAGGHGGCEQPPSQGADGTRHRRSPNRGSRRPVERRIRGF